jgi:hypothetical protein
MSLSKMKHTLNTYSPEICIGLGIVSFVASAIFAAKATPKAQKAKAENDEIKETMDEALEKGETASDELDENGNSIMIPYSEEDYKDDMKLYIGKKIVNETKPYLPAIGLSIAGTALILTGTGILKKRNAALTSLLATTTTLFSDYRSRVISDQGKEKDREYLTGVKKIKEEVVVTDAKGKDKKVEVEKTAYLDSSVGNIPWLSPYAVKITSTNCTQFESFKGDPVYVGHWLETVQEMINTHLHTDGVLYLDWALEQLGVKLDETNPTLNSYIAHNVGWIDTDYYYDAARKVTYPNEGDRYVDFGCWDDAGNLTLTTGPDGEVYLDFNVDGWINGRIPRKHAGYLQDQIEKHPEIEK